MMIKTIPYLICSLVASSLSTGLASAAPVQTVVELFTSQGCSSCPPADRLLLDLRDREGLLTLSWPVDYWDRLGWEDTFAEPMNAVRQAAYNKRLGYGGVYTPQMVFNGKAARVGSRVDEVNAELEAFGGENKDWFEPVLTIDADDVTVDLPDMGGMDDVIVRVVYYTSDASVQVGDGENQGRTLHYSNVVRSTEVIGTWTGRAQRFQLDASDARSKGADNVAILLQADYRHGPMIGAGAGRLDF